MTGFFRSSLAGVALVVLMSAARADEPSLADAYHFSGEYDGGRFERGSIALVRSGARASVIVDAREERERGAVTWRGAGALVGRVLTIRRRVAATPGIAGRLDGAKAAAAPAELEYVASFDARFERAKVVVHRVTEGGGRAELGSGVLRKDPAPWAHLPGDLVAIAREEIEKAIHKEVDLGRDFSIGKYAHVGARVATKVMTDGERTPLMKEADRLRRANGGREPFWIRTTAEGGPRVAWTTSIPIDPAGALKINAGFELGARIRYICEDQHELPAGVRDVPGALAVLETERARVLALPTRAGEVERLPLGTRRVLEGWGSLALSGGASFGHRLETLGVLARKVEAGASASVGVHWNLRGELRVELVRESGRRARVKWTRARNSALGAQASALVGLYVAPELVAAIPGPANKVLSAFVRRGESYARIQFDASASWTSSFELVADLVFDLGEEDGRRGFEAAILGNLVTAQELVAGTNRTGLVAATITSTLVDALTTSVSLKALDVLTLRWDSRSADVKVEVTTLDGTRATTSSATWSANRKGLFSDRTVVVDATEREVTKPGAPVERGAVVTFRITRDDARLSYFVADQHFALARLLLGGAVEHDLAGIVAARRPAGDHGATHLELEVVLGERSIDRVLATSRADFLRAYGRAFWERRYDWTPERCRLLEAPPGPASPLDRTIEEIELAEEAYKYRDAKWAADALAGAAKPGTSRTDRVAAFRTVARESGFELRAVVAFATLADPSDSSIRLALSGQGISLDRRVGRAPALPAR